MLAGIVTLLLVAMLFVVLGAIVRFSIVSGLRTRNARKRLRKPDPAGVERVCGFPPAGDLVDMYLAGSLTEHGEFTLADTSQVPVREWYIGEFYPLTGRDVAEQRKISGIKEGIPFADDLGKGTYFANRDGRIMYRPAGRKPKDVQVAESAKQLATFEVRLEG